MDQLSPRFQHKRRWRAFTCAIMLVGITSCSRGSDADGDDKGINDALLRTLTSDGTEICVDSGTYGEPLAVFRTMKLAPDAVRRLLHWSAPDALKLGRVLTNRELVDDELRGGQSKLPEFVQDKTRLSLPAQAQLNALADMASLVTPEPGVRLHNSAAAPLAKVRWWPLNRVGHRCDAVHTVSKPVIKRGIAFVTVTAAHQGTTYAFRKSGADWATIAKWSNWLY